MGCRRICVFSVNAIDAVRRLTTSYVLAPNVTNQLTNGAECSAAKRRSIRSVGFVLLNGYLQKILSALLNNSL